MILKTADDRLPDLDALEQLLKHPDAAQPKQRLIEQQIRNMRVGAKGERDAAYEIEFHYGASDNWMIIHDLRIETAERVAQIDHLLINRLLDVWVCETKQFSGGIAINDFGECSTYANGRSLSIPSPIEQNRKHCALLQDLFDDEHFPLPKRLGIRLKPRIHSIILCSKSARIRRPKAKVVGVDTIIKMDQLKAHIDRQFDQKSPLALAKLVSSEELRAIGELLVSVHCPNRFDWSGKFGLHRTW